MAATDPISLSNQARKELVEKKVACPFLAPAVATGQLAVHHEPGNPLVSIEAVRALGNTGGGDLGELLAFFAEGNHAFMRGPTGALTEAAPPGWFSLELPGSQGSHPGHSGILQGDPKTSGSGRFSEQDFQRLIDRAEDGFIKRSAVARFIAENLLRDTDSKVLGPEAVGLVARDLGQLIASIGMALTLRLLGTEHQVATAHRKVVEKLSRLTGENNLFGSAGEWGLLFAFFANKPGVQSLDDEPAVSVTDLRLMFVDKEFPEGWGSWKKTWTDWAANTTTLAAQTGREYLRQK